MGGNSRPVTGKILACTCNGPLRRYPIVWGGVALILRWVLLGLAMASAGAVAAVPEIPRFRPLTVADGLPSGHVPSLDRDRQGYLWVGTFDGVARYDGVGFRTWRHDPGDPASLPGNLVQAVHVDARDRVWVATENGGLSVMEGDRKGFRHFRKATHPQMLSDDVFAITSHGDAIWFGSFGGGLNRLDAQGAIAHFGASEINPASLPSDDVMALAFDDRGSLWVGTLNGLAIFDGRKFSRIDLPLPRPATRTIYGLVPEAGGMWVLTSEGIFMRDAQGHWKTPPWSQMFARPNALLNMAYGNDGNYWLAGQGGLWRTRGEMAPVPVSAQDAPGKMLQSLLHLPDGGMWVQMPARGIGYLQSDWRRMAVLSTTEGLAPGLHRGVAGASAGGVWLTSNKGVIERVDTSTGEVSVLEMPGEVFTGSRLGPILEDRRKQLWIGSRQGELARLDLRTMKLDWWDMHSPAGAPPLTGPIDLLLESPQGDIWLSSLGGGLQRRDGTSGEILDDINMDSGHGLQATDTEALLIGPDQALWLAGAQGLARWDAQARKFFPVQGLGTERIFSFVFQDAEQLWVQRLSGLEKWRLGAEGWAREQRFSVAEGIPAVESTGLKIDAAKHLWLSTRRGLFRIDSRTGNVRHFGIRTGLLNQEFTDSSLYLAGDGVLVGSTSDGSVMLLDTTFSDPPAMMPNLVLDNVQIGRDYQTLQLPVGGGFELQPGDHELHISARLLSFEDPLANRFRSRLQGF